MSRYKIESVGRMEERILEIIEDLNREKMGDKIEYKEIIARLKKEGYKTLPTPISIRNWILERYKDKFELVLREGGTRAGIKIKEGKKLK